MHDTNSSVAEREATEVIRVIRAPRGARRLDLVGTVLPRDICYCRACWRDDWHTPVRANTVVTLLAALATLGLSLYFWPYHCVACGKVRPRLALGRSLSSDEPG